MISISLPSIYPNAVTRAILNIIETSSTHVEIIVCAPFKIEEFDVSTPGATVVWVADKYRSGNVAAHAQSLEHATGEFITAFSDDHLYVRDWDLNALDDFHGLPNGPSIDTFPVKDRNKLCLGLRQDDYIGNIFGLYYPYFPFMPTEFARKTGWFSTRYKHYWADCHLALRVWEEGGMCVPSRTRLIETHEDDNRPKPDERWDMPAFVSHWKDKHPGNWDLSNIRNFNINNIPYPPKV